MKTSPIWYPDNVIIFVHIEPSVTYGLFNPELPQRRVGSATGSSICFVVVVTGPANKLGAEVAIKIIAENISFSLGCWSDCCNNRILIMVPDHLGLTGTQTSTQGSERSLRHILADAFPCTTTEQPSTTGACTRAQSETEQQQQMWMSSTHRCFLSTLGWSPLSVQPASHLTHLAQVAGDTWGNDFPLEPDNLQFAHGDVSFLFCVQIWISMFHNH